MPQHVPEQLSRTIEDIYRAESGRVLATLVGLIRDIDFAEEAMHARADLCRRLGRIPEARASYEKALTLVSKEPERRFLSRRLAELK
jgi:predicted RNA polymerase sigma factor